jgi:hypothetical protein
MTRDDISRMAEAAGFPARRAFSDLSDLYPRLERFADLVAAAEREACAQVCENYGPARLLSGEDCAAAIRTRG